MLQNISCIDFLNKRTIFYNRPNNLTWYQVPLLLYSQTQAYLNKISSLQSVVYKGLKVEYSLTADWNMARYRLSIICSGAVRLSSLFRKIIASRSPGIRYTCICKYLRWSRYQFALVLVTGGPGIFCDS